jgi:hypothetical protein
MKNIYLLKLLEGNICRIVFVSSFFLAYFLLPEAVFHHANRVLAIIYLLTFASLMTCTVRTIREKAGAARKSGASILGIIAAVIGISAFQVCGISAPVCGMSVGIGVVSAIFPSFLVSALEAYGSWLIYLSIIVQLLALYFLKCLHRK